MFYEEKKVFQDLNCSMNLGLTSISICLLGSGQLFFTPSNVISTLRAHLFWERRRSEPNMMSETKADLHFCVCVWYPSSRWWMIDGKFFFFLFFFRVYWHGMWLIMRLKARIWAIVHHRTDQVFDYHHFEVPHCAKAAAPDRLPSYSLHLCIWYSVHMKECMQLTIDHAGDVIDI